MLLDLTVVNYTECSATCGSGYRNVIYKCFGDFGTCTYSGSVCYPGDKIYAFNEVCHQNDSCRKLKMFIIYEVRKNLPICKVWKNCSFIFWTIL